MRFFCIAVLGLTLASIPANAQTGEKRVFGTYTCSQRVPCKSYGGLNSSQWAEAGKACVSKGFGYLAQSEGPLFDDLAGLDESNCLTTNVDSIPKTTVARMIPTCCVVALSGNSTNSCVFQCKLTQE